MNHQPAYRPDPAHQKTLHVGGPNIGDRKMFDRIVDEIFERRWFTNDGQVVQEFESKLKDYLGVKNIIAVCNATMGLQLVCHALELTGEVILPSFTFVATPHAVRWERLEPVFADVDINDHCISTDSIESVITHKTSAIMGVHLWGNPCNTSAIDAIATRYGLRVIYDAAHAFGCSQNGTMVGNFGDCEVFSFHATKFFNTFEGGAIATNDDELAKKIRLMKNFGFAGMDEVVHLGTNAKMPEVCAAMGLSMFGSIDRIKRTNQINYELYQSFLAPIAGVKLYPLEQLEETNWQYVVVEIDADRFGETRDDVFHRLSRNQVRARRYFYPGCHRMEPYKSEFRSTDRQLVNTDELCRKVLCLPTGSQVKPADVIRICGLILDRKKQHPTLSTSHAQAQQKEISKKKAFTRH